jgi:hypothetical protein
MGWVGVGVVAAVVVTAAGHAVACWLWPFAACWRCKGAGKFHAWWGGNAWRYCRRCGGKGARLRFGRRAYNYFRVLNREAR